MNLDQFVTQAVSDCVEARWYPPPPVDCKATGFIPCLNSPTPGGVLCEECLAEGRTPRLEVVEVCAYGRPAPQGSKRHVGHGVMIESSKAVKPWREAVKTAAMEVMAGGEPLDGPLAVRMVFTMPKPKSAPKGRRTWPDRTPDLSKLVRATEDALTDAGLWADDARVVEYDRVAKVFPNEDIEALHIPGVRISVRRVVAS